MISKIKQAEASLSQVEGSKNIKNRSAVSNNQGHTSLHSINSYQQDCEEKNNYNSSNRIIRKQGKQQANVDKGFCRILQRIHDPQLHIDEIYKAEEDRSTHKNECDQTSSEKQVSGQRASKLLIESQANSFIQIKFKKPLVYESEIFVACKYYSFDRRLVHISSCESILIEEKQIRTADIQKIDILPVTVKTNNFKIELFHKAGKHVFGVQLKRQLYLLPQHYIWFAKIINAKLAHKGFKLGPENQQSEQLKYCSTFCEGTVYKRSKHVKKWKERYVVITVEGLFSYKNRNENYSIFISMKDITKLQTEFQTYENNLVIIMYCQKNKYEFAIPIHDFCLKIPSNWLLASYRLLMEHKYHIKIA